MTDVCTSQVISCGDCFQNDLSSKTLNPAVTNEFTVMP